MRFLFRWAFRLFLVFVVIVVALILLKDAILKSALESRIQTQTGLGAKIGRFELGLLTPTITMEDCVLYNPPEFGGSPFVVLPELHIEYDRDALSRTTVHIKLLRLHLAQINVVENQQGQTNVLAIFGALEKAVSPGGAGGPANPKPVPPNFKGIDTLNLTLETLNYTSQRYPQRNRQINLGLTNEIVNNVRSPEDLSPVLLKILFRSGFSIFSNPKAAPSTKQPAKPPSAPR